MELDLKGKRALVTGASRGIGRAVAESLASEGCDLDLAARGRDDLEDLAENLCATWGISVRVHVADIASPEDQERLCKACEGAHILVNNAGSNPPGEIDETPIDTWRKAWDLKVFGYIALTRAMYAQMKKRREGVIINIIGVIGEKMNPRYIIGCAGNAALIGLTKALGGRSPDFGVRVVGVNPGLTATDRAKYMLQEWSVQSGGTADQWESYLKKMRLPFGRMVEPREVGDLVTYLASPRAAYISGTVVTIDGGAANR